MPYVRPIITDGHPTLRKVAKKIDLKELDDPLFQQLIDDMFETMYAAPGVGLAAPQVNVSKRLFVMDVGEDEEHPEGGVIVRFRASGMLELAWHLFTWGNKIEIVEPASLRQQITTEMRAALAHHEEPLRFTYVLDSKKAS